jgi:hypothetical protein
MPFGIGTVSRVLVIASVAIFAASCGGNGNKMDTSTPGANPGDNTRISTIPDPAGPDTASLTPSDQVVVIARNIWDDYQLYLSRVGQIGSGYYAVTEDGFGGASWSCSEALCDEGNEGKGRALEQCQATNPGKTCIIFAKNRNPQVRYEIAP